MHSQSIAQDYFVLAVTENGMMPVMRKDESNGGLVAAGFMDLLLNNVISENKKKITVEGGLIKGLEHLSSLYDYLAEKPRTTEKMMCDYLMSTSAKIKQLTADIGESLFEKHAVTKEEGGLLGRKTLYVPVNSYKEQTIESLKACITNQKETSIQNVALICILKETKNLNQYFSKYESSELEKKLKELKQNPENKKLAKMVNYVSDMSAMFFASMVIFNN